MRSLIWGFASCLNILWVLSYWLNIFGVSKLKWRLHRLVWVYSCQNDTLLEISCPRSNICFCFLSSSCPCDFTLGRPAYYTMSSNINMTSFVTSKMQITIMFYFLNCKNILIFDTTEMYPNICKISHVCFITHEIFIFTFLDEIVVILVGIFLPFWSWDQGPVEFGKILFEPSNLGNLMQSERTGLPF